MTASEFTEKLAELRARINALPRLDRYDYHALESHVFYFLLGGLDFSFTDRAQISRGDFLRAFESAVNNLEEKVVREKLGARATYAGYQPGYGDKPGFILVNLTEPWGNHPAGSSVSFNSLLAA